MKEGRSFGNVLKRKEGRSLGNGGSIVLRFFTIHTFYFDRIFSIIYKNKNNYIEC